MLDAEYVAHSKSALGRARKETLSEIFAKFDPTGVHPFWGLIKYKK